MRCETAHRMMMDRLYETLTPEKNNLLDIHLKTCHSCQSAWREVQHAHTFMLSMPEKPIPVQLQKSILQQKDLEALPPDLTWSWHGWRRWSVAAVFLILLGTSITLWQNEIPPSSPDATVATPDINNLAYNTFKESLNKLTTAKHSPAKAIEAQEKVQPKSHPILAESVPSQEPSVSLTVSAPLGKSSHSAEELFKTGLRLYNNAFTKTGEDQKTLLHSAILMLQDMEKLYPEESSWIAMGMILIADSFRALDETDEAISTYQRMTERYPDLPTYCQQARASMIRLMLNRDDRLETAEQELMQYKALKPPATEYAQLALAFSEKIASTSSAQALLWYRQVMETLPIQHPISLKASENSSRIEFYLRDRYYVPDWSVVGPFPQETVPLIDPRKANQDVIASLAKQAKGRITRKTVSRNFDPIQYDVNQIEVDLAELLKQAPRQSCTFAQTFIWSPKEQEVLFYVGSTDGLRIWLNHDPIFGEAQPQDYVRDSSLCASRLQEGWNTLLLKCFHIRDVPEWKFSVLITDPMGHLIPDLQYETSLRKTISSQKTSAGSSTASKK